MNKLVCKIWSQSDDKYGPHELLGVYGIIYATFSMSKIGLKIEKKNDCSMKYFPTEKTYMQKLYQPTYKYGIHKHLGAHTPINAAFS